MANGGGSGGGGSGGGGGSSGGGGGMSAGQFFEAGGSVLGAIGTLQAGVARASALKTQAAIARQNATLRLQVGTVEEGRTRRLSERALGQQAARIGKSGVTFSGSMLDVIQQSAAEAELNALNVRHQAVTQAHGLLTEAGIKKAAAKNAVRAARLQAATQLLEAAGKAAGGAG